MNISPTMEQWIEIAISVVIILIAVFAGRRIVGFILQRVLKRLIRLTTSSLDDVVYEAIAPVLYWLAVVYAFQFSLSRLAHVFEFLRFDLERFFFVLYLTIGFSAAWRLISNVAKWYERQLVTDRDTDIGKQLMPFIRRVALIILMLIVAIILLDRFNVEVSGLVATLGIGSLAIALAAQAALADIVSGFVIMVDRPYRIGDRIEILELDTWGDVEDVGLRSTRIRTRDNRMVIVPNSVIGKSLIVNYSYPTSEYRIEIHIGVAYGTELEKARQVMVEAVQKVDGVLNDRPVEALFLEFGESALVFRVRWWLDSYADTRRMFDKVNTALYNELTKAGIVIPFPQLEVRHKGLPSQFAMTRQ